MEKLKRLAGSGSTGWDACDRSTQIMVVTASASLAGDDGGDGMAVDAEGRLYVTGNAGVHVIAADGEYLDLMPTRRRPITLAFSGEDKRWLYVPQMGAIGPDGQPFSTPEGVRNVAMTMYRVRVETPGYGGRPK